MLGAISCCIFRFASIKCYHIATQNPTFIFRTTDSRCSRNTVCSPYDSETTDNATDDKSDSVSRIQRMLATHRTQYRIHIKAYINLTSRCVFIVNAAILRRNGISEFVYNVVVVVVVNVCVGMFYSGTYKSMICYTFDAVYPFTNYAFIEISIRVDLSRLRLSHSLVLLCRALSLSG